MARTIQEGDVAERLSGHEAERLGVDLQDLLALELAHLDVVGRELAVGRFVLREREGLHVAEFGHRKRAYSGGPGASIAPR